MAVIVLAFYASVSFCEFVLLGNVVIDCRHGQNGHGLRERVDVVIRTCENSELKHVHFTTTAPSRHPRQFQLHLKAVCTFKIMESFKTSDGSQPETLRRTKYLHYVNSGLIPDPRKIQVLPADML